MHVKELVIPEHIESASSEQVLAWSLEAFQPRIGLCTSFAAEGVVLIDMLTKLTDRVRIFTLDTGRLMPETYAVMEAIRERYDLDIEVFFPRTEAVEAMTREEGVNLFYRSVEARQRCCAVRKVEPLERALAGLDAWIAGLRRDQAETRTEVRKVEIDEAHGGIVKINPLADWTWSEVWSYIRAPRHPVQRAPRPGVSEHRLRAVHAGGGAGRGPAGRALVVGGRSRREGVRPAPRSAAGIGARRDRELGVRVRMAFTLLRGCPGRRGAPSRRRRSRSCACSTTRAEPRPRWRSGGRSRCSRAKGRCRSGGSSSRWRGTCIAMSCVTADRPPRSGSSGSALFRADAERVIADAAGSLWMIDRHHD